MTRGTSLPCKMTEDGHGAFTVSHNIRSSPHEKIPGKNLILTLKLVEGGKQNVSQALPETTSILMSFSGFLGSFIPPPFSCLAAA